MRPRRSSYQFTLLGFCVLGDLALCLACDAGGLACRPRRLCYAAVFLVSAAEGVHGGEGDGWSCLVDGLFEGGGAVHADDDKVEGDTDDLEHLREQGASA